MPRWDSTRRLSFDAALRRPLETDLQTLRAKGVADHNKEESVRIVRFVSPIGISRQSAVPTGVKRGMLPNSQILESGGLGHPPKSTVKSKKDQLNQLAKLP